MRLWALAFSLLPLLGTAYVMWRVWCILPLVSPMKWAILAAVGGFLILFFVSFLVNLDKISFPIAATIYEVSTAWIFILLYLFMLFLLLDFAHLIHVVPRSFLHNSVIGSLFVVITMTVVFVLGNLNYNKKVRKTLTINTEKPLERPLKVVLLSDLHIGYTNRLAELRRWIGLINAENADLVIVGGDIIDGSLRAIDHQNMADELQKIKAPVYASLGNHEYYAGVDGAVDFYKRAGIRLLRDESVSVDGINIVGRDDRTNVKRRPLSHLMEEIDRSRFTLLIDHQPYKLEKAERERIDFQFSGHTHYGQVWPISWIEDRIYEDAYGLLRKGSTTYYVSSGMGIWGGKFRIGTQSEYIVLEIRN